MPRRNHSKNSNRYGHTFSTEYVSMPNQPWVYAFRIESLRLLCINTAAYRQAIQVRDVRKCDDELLDLLQAQI